MSDTPRMNAARNAAMEHSTGDVWRVGCDIECELNAANAEIEEKRKDVVWLATEKAKLEERIKRLEEGGDKAILNSYMPDRLAVWTKAKEAKL